MTQVLFAVSIPEFHNGTAMLKYKQIQHQTSHHDNYAINRAITSILRTLK